jgi:hypothetical protein
LTLTDDMTVCIVAGAKVVVPEVTSTEGVAFTGMAQAFRATKHEPTALAPEWISEDIIASKLVEVNCVSPGCILRINWLNGLYLESKVIDFIEQRAATSFGSPH